MSLWRVDNQVDSLTLSIYYNETFPVYPFFLPIGKTFRQNCNIVNANTSLKNPTSFLSYVIHYRVPVICLHLYLERDCIFWLYNNDTFISGLNIIKALLPWPPANILSNHVRSTASESDHLCVEDLHKAGHLSQEDLYKALKERGSYYFLYISRILVN